LKNAQQTFANHTQWSKKFSIKHKRKLAETAPEQSDKTHRTGNTTLLLQNTLLQDVPVYCFQFTHSVVLEN
jgi:ribosome biogenesis GTPase A